MSVHATRIKYEVYLLGIEGVIGVGEATDKILVYVKDEEAATRVPLTLDGIPVQTIVSGEVVAL